MTIRKSSRGRKKAKLRPGAIRGSSRFRKKIKGSEEGGGRFIKKVIALLLNASKPERDLRRALEDYILETQRSSSSGIHEEEDCSNHG